MKWLSARNGRRRLQFEQLDQRTVFALGDIDLNFAQAGEHAVSYSIANNTQDYIVQSFASGEGRLFVANSTAGNGPVLKLFRTDAQGQLDVSFGSGGQVSIVDKMAAPRSILAAQKIGEDTYIALMLNSDSGLASIVAFNSQGALKSEFGDQGWLRLPIQRFQFESQIFADQRGGFLLLSQFDTTLTLVRYDAEGAVDRSFGVDGQVSAPRLINPSVRVVDSGTITLAGLQSIQNKTRLSLTRWLPTGQLDTTFGNQGKSLSTAEVTYAHPALSPDGNSVFMYFIGTRASTGDQYRILKFNSDAQLDLEYGDQGAVELTFPSYADYPQFHKLLIDSSDRVYFSISKVANASQRLVITVARLDPQGQLDTTFGTAGISHKTFTTFSLRGFAQQLQLTSDGILWTGLATAGTNGSTGTDGFALRMFEDGSYDESWGDGGLMLVDLTRPSQTVDMLKLYHGPDSHMQVVSGWPASNNGVPTPGQIQTLDDAGDVLATAPLNRNTFVGPAYAPSVDGGWYAVALLSNQQNNLAITKYTSSGVVDNAFGDTGTLLIPTDSMRDVLVRAFADGSVMVLAHAFSDHADSGRGVVVMARIGAGGALDPSFGDAGVLRLYDKPGTVVDMLDGGPSGTFIVYTDAYGFKVFVQRLDATGSTVTSYGDQGVATATGIAEWKDTAVDEQGRVLILSSDYSATTTQWLRLDRLEADGQPDTMFGEAGSLAATKTQSILFDNASLAVRQGVIAVATTGGFEQSALRLIAVDYAGKPLEELGPDGTRDYELAEYGEQVEDLAFAEDGALWLAYTARGQQDLTGKVIRLEGSTTQMQHNWDSAADVNADEHVSAIDALMIINLLNGGTNDSGIFPDVNADTRITAIDALLVINRLNAAKASGEGEAEAEMLDHSWVNSAESKVDYARSKPELWQLIGFDLDSVGKRRHASRISL